MSTIDSGPADLPADPRYPLAMAVLAETGNQTTAAAAVGVDHSTVSNWAANPRSSTMLEELRASIRYRYGWRMVQAFGSAMDRIDSALERGVPYIYKGEVRYHPQSPKEAAITASVLFNMWTLSNGTLRDSTIPARIDALSQQVAALGDKLTGGESGGPSLSSPSGTPSMAPAGENLSLDENGHPPHSIDNKNKALLGLGDIGG